MVRTFHDLRSFTATAPRPDTSPSGDAFAAARRALPVADASTGVFALDLPAGSGRIDSLAADEFLLVLSGEVTLTPSNSVPRSFGMDECFVLVKGTGFTWSAPRDATLIVLSYPAGGGEKGLHPVDQRADLAPAKPPLVDLLVGDVPDCRSHIDYLSANGEFVCGVWDSTPYHRMPMRYGHCELMHLLQGSVTLIDQTGHEATFAKGDVFFVEAGATCSWESREHVAKVYAIHRPA